MRISDWSSDVCSSDLITDLISSPAQNDGPSPWTIAQRTSRRRRNIFCAASIALSIGKSMPLWRSARISRSEERRVGKECVSKCRSRWTRYHEKKKKKKEKKQRINDTTKKNQHR